MKSDKNQGRVAEPAEEEIKKHGDPMKQQVAEAAGKEPPKEERKPDEGDGEP